MWPSLFNLGGPAREILVHFIHLKKSVPIETIPYSDTARRPNVSLLIFSSSPSVLLPQLQNLDQSWTGFMGYSTLSALCCQCLRAHWALMIAESIICYFKNIWLLFKSIFLHQPNPDSLGLFCLFLFHLFFTPQCYLSKCSASNPGQERGADICNNKLWKAGSPLLYTALGWCVFIQAGLTYFLLCLNG